MKKIQLLISRKGNEPYDPKVISGILNDLGYSDTGIKDTLSLIEEGKYVMIENIDSRALNVYLPMLYTHNFTYEVIEPQPEIHPPKIQYLKGFEIDDEGNRKMILSDNHNDILTEKDISPEDLVSILKDVLSDLINKNDN